MTAISRHLLSTHSWNKYGICPHAHSHAPDRINITVEYCRRELLATLPRSQPPRSRLNSHCRSFKTFAFHPFSRQIRQTPPAAPPTNPRILQEGSPGQAKFKPNVSPSACPTMTPKKFRIPCFDDKTRSFRKICQIDNHKWRLWPKYRCQP